jgi:hypothetical protein
VIDAVAIMEGLGQNMETAFADLVLAIASRDSIAYAPARVTAEAAALALADQRQSLSMQAGPWSRPLPNLQLQIRT